MSSRRVAEKVCVGAVACPDCGGIGQDENAHFFCSTCHGEGTVPTALRHYEVLSPEIQFRGFSGYEPPEWGCCWGLYLAVNRADARKLAVRDSEFEVWVNEMRADNKPPFAGLEVRLPRCHHGECWGCGCPKCDEEEETGLPVGWADLMPEITSDRLSSEVRSFGAAAQRDSSPLDGAR